MKGLSKSVSVLLCSVLLTGVAMPAQATDLKSQLNQYKREVNQLNTQLSQEKQQAAAATAQAVSLQQSIDTLNESIAEYQKNLAQEQQNLKELEDQKQKLENERQQHIQALGQYLRSNYEDGVTSYLQVLFQATSLSEFLDRLEQVHFIVNTYDKLQTELTELNKDLEKQQTAIEHKTQAIQVTLKEKQETQQKLQQALSKQQTLIAQLNSQARSTLKATLAAQSKVDRVQQLIAQQELEARLAAADQKAGVSRGGDEGGIKAPAKVSGGAKGILDYAAQFLGLPYVWGGTTPTPGFDCSGFVQYVYGHFGVKLNRTSQAQFNQGTPVSRSDLKPGDLVFFSTYGPGATHVGIYVGNNTMIDSSNGGVVYQKITDAYWGPRYLGARRVISE